MLGCVIVAGSVLSSAEAQAHWIWIEGEQPARSAVNRHPWYARVDTGPLSGGDFLAHFDEERPGEATYRFKAPGKGEYAFWIHANPVKAKLSYTLNGGKEMDVDFSGDALEQMNIAADGAVDLRFVAWIRVGMVSLKKGANEIRFRMTSELQHHGLIDCFVFADEPFTPYGTAKPDEIAEVRRKAIEANAGWFVFDPPEDPFDPESGIDLRFLNERFAGEKGRIVVTDGRFAHEQTGEPVRFWAVNGPPSGLKGDDLKRCARMLAKRGVNLVRAHGAVFDRKTGKPDLARMEHLREIVDAMGAEGIYTLLSIYFPLWFTPEPGLPWLQGYDGNKHPFAALFFNPGFEERYREWWRLLLTGKGGSSGASPGKALTKNPALMGVELVNEDSYFFWTFDARNIPDPQLKMLEQRFGTWLAGKHGTIEKALAAWGGRRLDRDAPGEGRVAFRPLWNLFNEKTARDRDTAAFLLKSQMDFYRRSSEYLRELGFTGLITCSNWHTASAEILGPLEKLSYTVGDFIDRHGYFGCFHKGKEAAWSIRDGHTYRDRSALRFDGEGPDAARAFNHPVMDILYNDRPSMISETAFTRPNRYRTEAPLVYAAYGALQGTSSIVHFALDSARWAVKPGFFMQPWTLMTPTQAGQFPAAALIFRRGLVEEGDVLADLRLKTDDLLDLTGTPLPHNAAFDELRLADLPEKGKRIEPGGRIDPLIHFAGRTRVTLGDRGGNIRYPSLDRFIDHEAKTVVSTHGQLRLDYGRGVLRIDAPRAQGAVGDLSEASPITLSGLIIESGLALGAVVAVALDEKPLKRSTRILLQVMSEEMATGFETAREGPVKRIVSIGRDPWLVKEIEGRVRFKRSDARTLEVRALDGNGDAIETIGNAADIVLRPDVLYYLITKP